jgi:hypothetical protein
MRRSRAVEDLRYCIQIDKSMWVALGVLVELENCGCQIASRSVHLHSLIDQRLPTVIYSISVSRGYSLVGEDSADLLYQSENSSGALCKSQSSSSRVSFTR